MPEIYLTDLEQNINFDSKNIKIQISFYDDNLTFSGWFIQTFGGSWFKIFI